MTPELPEDEPNPSTVDDELRRLFADERLDLPVSRDADAAVVAGARRRRRNRMALATAGGVVPVLAIVFAGATLSGLVHPTGRVSAAGPVLSTTAVTTTSPTPVTTPTQVDPMTVLGPYGVADLRLGMSWKQALDSGELRQSAAVSSAGCLRYTVLIEPIEKPTGAPNLPATTTDAPGSAVPMDVAEVVVSVHDGVVQVIAGPRLRTPEGIGVGSTRDALADAYPELDLPTRGGTGSVGVLDNPQAVYVFNLSGTGTVTSFSLRMAKSSCLG